MEETIERRPQPMEPEQRNRHLDDWLELAREVGLDRFTLGLKRAWLEVKWFPNPAEINERIPETGAKLEVKYDNKCEFCWGTGRRPESGKPRSQETMLERMKRCDCRQIEFKRGA